MTGVYIWGSGLHAGVLRETTPDEIRGMSPLWKADIDSLEPWEETVLEADHPNDRWWRSGSASADAPVVITGTCSSSLDIAWALFRKGLFPEWGTVLAVSQWLGRGRKGRVWHSPPGNVYAALRLPGTRPPWHDLTPLTVSHFIIEVLHDLGLDVKIKWPNDLVIEGRKFGGILIEEQGEAIVAGVGINIVSAPEPGQLRDEQAVRACALAEFGYAVSPVWLWRHILDAVRTCHERATAIESPPVLLSRMEKDLAYIGQEVVVEPAGEPAYRATVLGLDPNGGLKVRAGLITRVVRDARISPVDD